MEQLNFLDYLAIALFAFGVLRGVFRGLIKEVSAIIGVLAGFYAAYSYYPLVDPYLVEIITAPHYRHIASFVIIFAGVFISISLVGVVLKMVLNIAFLGWVDRLGGGIFGAVKSILILAAMMVALTTFLPKNDTLVKSSVVAPWIASTAEVLVQAVPSDMKTMFREKLKGARDAWKKNQKI